MRKVLSILFLISLMFIMNGCFWLDAVEYSFTTDDGITYYTPNYKKFKTNYFTIIDIEDKEEISIPEYVGEDKVSQLANVRNEICNYYTKSVTIRHEIRLYKGSYFFGDDYSVFFPNLETLTYLDYIYCNLTTKKEELTIPWYLGEPTKQKAEVILKRTDRIYNCENFIPKVISIPEYVTTIEKGVFDNLENVIIKTSYVEKPVGWDEGWNGDCEVMWGEEIDTSTTYYSGVTEEGIEYTTDFDIVEIRRFLDIGLNKYEYEIPEYIDGFRVTIITLDIWDFENWFEPRVFIAKHDVYIFSEYPTGQQFEKIIYIDYLDNVRLYKRSVISLNGEGYKYPIMELRKSDKESNTDLSFVKEIIILDNVTVIESGVFDGLTNAVIKTSYKEKPEGWEEGWNGDCEVIWGVEFEGR